MAKATKTTLVFGGVCALVLVLLWTYFGSAADQGSGDRGDPHSASSSNGPEVLDPRPSAMGTERTTGNGLVKAHAGADYVASVLAGIETIFAPADQDLYPVTQLASQLGWLQAMAESGDIKAARTLYHALKVCETVPRDEAELAQSIARIHHPESIHASLQAMQGIDLNRQEFYQTRLFQRCGALPNHVVAERSKWLEQVAESGDSRARLDYLLGGRPGPEIDWRGDKAQLHREFVERARGYLELELASGNPQALRGIGISYRRGIAHDPDPIMAYAYYHALTMTGEAPPAATAAMGNMVHQLSPNELAQAEEIGREIYSACCG
jgi:hypothetical protein